jgi:hypothetical protein
MAVVEAEFDPKEPTSRPSGPFLGSIKDSRCPDGQRLLRRYDEREDSQASLPLKNGAAKNITN